MRRLIHDDLDSLHSYLTGLSEETKKRFGPHPFDLASLSELFILPELHEGYVAIETETLKIIAYSIIKKGFLEHDRPRLEGYGLVLDQHTDATYAPSVADEWQGLGVSPRLYRFMITDLLTKGVKRILLWGGVQCDNPRAVSYYRKLGFTILGQFEYYGWNYDMIKGL